MKDINEAFEILGNLEKRRRYHPVWLQKIGRGVPGPEPAMEKSPAGSSPTDEVNVPPVSRRNGFPNVVRWIAIIPAGLAVAVLVMFPVHWLIVITAALGDNPFLGLLSAETAERLANAFTSPFFFIYIGARIAPTHRGVTSIVLAIIMALIMGGVYVLAFTGGPMFRGWSSLYFGATPVLNLLGIASALYKVRSQFGIKTG